mmetsp:Transcript_53773/g.136544  ORF Transcript_53773/g.136544 Transcript_53773/m.136544 type:complete len:126 (+) Transcript_53773:50-427(+)
MSYGKAMTGGKGKAHGAGPYGKGGPQADDSCKVFVGNLNFKTRWQTLKDFMAQAGTVNHAKILMKDGGKGWDKGWGKGGGLSRGMGVVEFASAEEAQLAVATLNGMELDGRAIQVDAWTTGWQKA